MSNDLQEIHGQIQELHAERAEIVARHREELRSVNARLEDALQREREALGLSNATPRGPAVAEQAVPRKHKILVFLAKHRSRFVPTSEIAGELGEPEQRVEYSLRDMRGKDKLLDLENGAWKLNDDGLAAYRKLVGSSSSAT